MTQHIERQPNLGPRTKGGYSQLTPCRHVVAGSGPSSIVCAEEFPGVTVLLSVEGERMEQRRVYREHQIRYPGA